MHSNGSSPGSHPDEHDLHLRDLLNLVRRNLAFIAGIVALVVGATAWYTWTTAPVFEARATIHVDRERQPVLPDLNLIESVLSGSNVETEMALLRARHIAEVTVDSLALQVQLVRPQGTARDSLFAEVSASSFTAPERYTLVRSGDVYEVRDRSGAAVTELPVGEARIFNGVRLVLRENPDGGLQDEIVLQVSDRYEAIDNLVTQLGVGRPFRDANVIAVSTQGTDPALVKDVPNTVARTFIAQRIAEKKTEAISLVRFLSDQLATYQIQLQDAENAVLAFEQDEQIVNLQAEGAEQVARRVALQSERDETRSDLSTLTGILDEIERTSSDPAYSGPSPFSRLAGFRTFLENQAVTGLLSDLTRLSSELTDQLERRERINPEVQAVLGQIAGVEDQLLQLALSYQGNLQTSINSLNDRLATFGAELQLIPEKAVQQARLERRKSSLEQVYNQLQARVKEAEIAQAVELGDVSISDLAVDPRDPIRPRKLRSLLLSVLFGLTLGLGLATARDYLDETVHTREDLGRITGLPVLGLIPRIQGLSNGNGRRLLRKDKPVKERLVTRDDISNPVSEAYRAFRTNITFLDLERPAQILVFTSPGPAEGKSTSAANLAITLAQQGTNALLMDCDLRRGIVHRVFGAEKMPGLTNVVLGDAKLSDAIHTVEVGEGRTLDFLPTGTLPPNPSELLGSTRMRELVRQLRERYSHVLMDSPPLNVVTDAAVLGTIADGVILIARAGFTDRGAIRFARDQLEAVQAPLSGVVLNDVDFKGRDRYYGSGDGYRYYYRYYKADV